ncbi:MAG: imidazolonepropionase [Pseudomonadota bacterium]
MPTTLLTNAAVLRCRDAAPEEALLTDASIALEADRIRWCGPSAEMPVAFGSAEQYDLQGRLVTPALIDCHTHLVHGGNRAWEFEERLNGVHYSDIATRGGGINATVSATRGMSEDTLLRGALRRVDALLAEGVGTLEIKSGYGLDGDTELRMLRVARRVAEDRAVEVRTSFLGAHAVPPEYTGDADAYIDSCCLPALEAAAAAGLVDAVDGFCEHIAFTPPQIERVFARAQALHLPVKLHAEQLSNLGGARLAARYRALSVDHLEFLHADDIPALRQAGTVAVLLPGAYYTLRETRSPPVEALRAAGVPMAVATDCNPGSSPLSSLLLAMNMACTLFGLTPREALLGATRNAARALGLSDRGQVAAGQRADLAVWDVEHPAELAYRIGFNPLHRRMHAGRWVA